jgi:adenosylhomocysteinase
MNTPIFSKAKHLDPIYTPHGEVVYELIGRAENHGAAQAHSLAHIHIPAGKASRPHRHQVSEESYYIISGQARIVIDRSEFSLSSGEACLISPGQVHQIFNAGPDDLEFLAVCVPPWVPEDAHYTD